MICIVEYPTITERLNSKSVRTPSGCLEWTGNTDSAGYGQIKIDKKPVAIHRLAWELVNGPIPDGLCVLHHCDNPPCWDAVDTEHHLFLGTMADNTADMMAKGRQRNGKTSKLSTGAAIWIRAAAADGVSSRTLAAMFGVSHWAVRNILDGKTWVSS